MLNEKSREQHSEEELKGMPKRAQGRSCLQLELMRGHIVSRSIRQADLKADLGLSRLVALRSIPP